MEDHGRFVADDFVATDSSWAIRPVSDCSRSDTTQAWVVQVAADADGLPAADDGLPAAAAAEGEPQAGASWLRTMTSLTPRSRSGQEQQRQR